VRVAKYVETVREEWALAKTHLLEVLSEIQLGKKPNPEFKEKARKYFEIIRKAAL